MAAYSTSCVGFGCEPLRPTGMKIVLVLEARFRWNHGSKHSIFFFANSHMCSLVRAFTISNSTNIKNVSISSARLANLIPISPKNVTATVATTTKKKTVPRCGSQVRALFVELPFRFVRDQHRRHSPHTHAHARQHRSAYLPRSPGT